MPIKSYNPTTKSRRYIEVIDYSELTKKAPEKALTKGKPSTGARNNLGRMTTRFRGGGNKRAYRQVDFYRTKVDVPAKVIALEYDPNRSAFLALIVYEDGEKSYIIAPQGLKIGQIISSGSKAEIKPGNALKLKDIPVGTQIHNLEFIPGQGAKLIRSAGQYAILRSKEGSYCQVKLPSGEIRKFHINCLATIGQVGNLDHMNVSLGKAGKKRYLGFRPHVRGVVQNPVDHPMGGGEGRSSGGGHPVSPWGQLAKGKRTRHPKKPSNKFIVERRRK